MLSIHQSSLFGSVGALGILPVLLCRVAGEAQGSAAQLSGKVWDAKRI